MIRENVRLMKKLFFSLACSSMLAVISGPALAAPWSFGIISDTQWKSSPDGKNPNYVAVNVINHINQEFIDHGVKFVVAVGDISQNGDILGLDTSATFRQALYNAGIGFYPLRGNHESSAAAAAEFVRLFPQTQTGINNQTPADALVTTPYFGPPPANTRAPFAIGTNFTAVSPEFAGLTYSFDYENARFVLIDQFTPPSGASHSILTGPEVEWVGSRLSERPKDTHAFVFAHKHLISENHADTLFGSDPSANPDGLQDRYMSYLFTNNVHYHIGGHDHMHNRALIASPDGHSVVQNIVTASDSYKFYIPKNPSNDEQYNIPVNGITNGPRETEIAQQLFTIGYYIVTVDGPRVTVDYYASPNGCNGDCDEDNDIIPYTFTRQETFGYSLNGEEFLVAEGGSYDIVDDQFGKTRAHILSGMNSSTATDYIGRPLSRDVSTGWTERETFSPKDHCRAASDILTLWGMADLGNDETDVYVLAISYDPEKSRPEHLGKGEFGLVTKDAYGEWVNAVDMNYGGAKHFVKGPWKAGYGLGTYGVDPDNKTAWAVVNYTGEFAAAEFCNNESN